MKIEISKKGTEENITQEIGYYEFFNIVAKPIIARYYSTYRKYYARKLGDIKDIEQEILIVLWKEHEQNEMKPKEKQLTGENLGRYLTVVVKRRLSHLKRMSQEFYYELQSKTSEKTKGSHINNYIKKDISIVALDDKFININLHQKLHVKNYLQKNIFSVVKDMCSEKDYTIIYNKFYKGLTFKEIGKILHMNKATIYQRYVKIMKEISKKNKIVFNFCNFLAIIHMRG